MLYYEYLAGEGIVHAYTGFYYNSRNPGVLNLSEIYVRMI